MLRAFSGPSIPGAFPRASRTGMLGKGYPDSMKIASYNIKSSETFPGVPGSPWDQLLKTNPTKIDPSARAESAGLGIQNKGTELLTRTL